VKSAKKLLIVVDDEPDITSSLKLGLERRGMDVTAFNDPLKALEELKKQDNYDLVITDIRMPKMSGFELYRKIRKQGVGTPVVFMTAFDVHQKEFEKMFPDLKPKALLRKPISISELAARVDEILDGHNASADVLAAP
jgi:two-component system, OmpR family, response regulator ChvI